MPMPSNMCPYHAEYSVIRETEIDISINGEKVEVANGYIPLIYDHA
jgi:hypothetical protein